MLMDLGWDEHACPPVKWEAWEKWRVKSLLRQTYCSATCCVTFSHSFSTKLTWQDTWRCCLRQKENRNDAQSAPAEGQQSSAAAYSNNSVVCDWCFCIFFFLLSNKYVVKYCLSFCTQKHNAGTSLEFLSVSFYFNVCVRGRKTAGNCSGSYYFVNPRRISGKLNQKDDSKALWKGMAVVVMNRRQTNDRKLVVAFQQSPVKSCSEGSS